MSTNKSFSAETSERYSRALFEVLKEANELEKTEADIKNLMFLLKYCEIMSVSYHKSLA